MVFGQNLFKNLTVLKISMGVMLCLTLISCLDDSYQLHKRHRMATGNAEHGTASGDVENPQQVDLLLDQMAQFPTGQTLKTFYDQNQANIQIIQQPTQQTHVSLETTLHLASFTSISPTDEEVLDVIDLMSNSYSRLQLFIEQSENDDFKCSILINDHLEENIQIHLLAHQLEICRIEMDIYLEMTTHEDIPSSQIAQFFALKDRIANGEAIDANETLMSLVTNLEAYSKLNALLMNQKLKAENLPLDVDLEDNRVLAEAVLSDLNERYPETIQASEEHILSMAREQTIRGIIDNFLTSSHPNSPSGPALLESSTEYSSDVYKKPITLQPVRTKNINRFSFNKKTPDPNTHTNANAHSNPDLVESNLDLEPTPNTHADSNPDLESTFDSDLVETHADSNPNLESIPNSSAGTHTDPNPKVEPPPPPPPITTTTTTSTSTTSIPAWKIWMKLTGGEPLCCKWEWTRQYCMGNVENVCLTK